VILPAARNAASWAAGAVAAIGAGEVRSITGSYMLIFPVFRAAAWRA